MSLQIGQIVTNFFQFSLYIVQHSFFDVVTAEIFKRMKSVKWKWLNIVCGSKRLELSDGSAARWENSSMSGAYRVMYVRMLDMRVFHAHSLSARARALSLSFHRFFLPFSQSISIRKTFKMHNDCRICIICFASIHIPNEISIGSFQLKARKKLNALCILLSPLRLHHHHHDLYNSFSFSFEPNEKWTSPNSPSHTFVCRCERAETMICNMEFLVFFSSVVFFSIAFNRNGRSKKKEQKPK